METLSLKIQNQAAKIGIFFNLGKYEVAVQRCNGVTV